MKKYLWVPLAVMAALLLGWATLGRSHEGTRNPPETSGAEHDSGDRHRARSVAGRRRSASRTERVVVPDPLDRVDPNEDETVGALRTYFGTWSHSEFDSDLSQDVRRDVDEVLADFAVRPTSTAVSCRGDTCRVRFLFQSFHDLQRLDAIDVDRRLDAHNGLGRASDEGAVMVVYIERR